MEHSMRIVARLRKALAPAGLDVVIPLSVESYNAYLEAASPSAASDLTRFKLPVPSGSSPASQPAAPLGCHDTTASPSPRRSSNLLVLVGNSRAMWSPFLEFVAREMAQTHDGRVQPDPIDRYVQQSVHACLRELASDRSDGERLEVPETVYWVADTEPGKMILAQKMALAAKQVSHCPPSQLCLHPVLGPWLAFRCALVFAAEGIDAASERGTAQPPVCSHDEATHTELAALMETAFAQARANGKCILPSAWRAWALPRILAAPGHPMMYAPEQILYHYTKDLALLESVVDAQRRNLSTDYLRTAPAPHVIECRRLLQQVLRECAERYPSGVDAILLSGGLDTSILAEASGQAWLASDSDESPARRFALSLDKHGAARPLLTFTHALTLQAHPDAQDAVYAARIATRLSGVSLAHHHVLHATLDELLAHAPDVTRILATCDPMELRNSLVIYATLARAAALGVKHVVTGDGADEIFCGYSFYHRMDEAALRAYRDQIVDVMQFTAPRLAVSFGITVTSPFLDTRVVAFAQSLSKAELIGARTPVPVDGHAVHGKLVLRQAFPESYSQWRSKEPIEAGSGTTALRLGYFDARWSDAEFAALQREIFQHHRVFVRDREHLFFVQAFLAAFDHDLSSVPKQRCLSDTDNGDVTGDDATRYCPACYFALSHAAQDFCVTCGFWPTRATATNDAKGYATQALARLEQDKQRLAAA